MPEFKPNLTPDDLREHMNSQHGVGPQLAGMTAYPAHLLPEADQSWQEWYVQYFHGRRTPDDQKQILRWKRMKTLHGDKLAENPTPRRAFALKAWAIDPLKLIDGRSKAKLEKAMSEYKTKAEDRHVKAASLSCPCCGKVPGKYKIHGDAIQCGDCKKISDMDAWEKNAFEEEDLHKLAAVLNRDFRACIGEHYTGGPLRQEIMEFLGSRPDIDAELLYARLGDSKQASFDVPDGIWWMEKLARYGAGVLFKQPNGKYLLQENGENDCDDPEGVGKLRPAGGGKNKSDHNLRATILREMEEEFDIDPDVASDKVELLGYINDGSKFDGCALFEMADHGLKPGTYQASNSKHEKIKLVEASLDDPKYIGSKKLRHFADKRSCHYPESEYRGGNEDFNESAWDERNTGIPGLAEREGQVLQSKQSAFPNIRGAGDPNEPGMAGRFHAVLPGHGAAPEAPHAGSGECKQGVLQGELQVASAGGADAEHDAKPENNIPGENSVLDGLVKKIGNLVQRATPEVEKLAGGGGAEHQAQRQAGDSEEGQALHLEGKKAHLAAVGGTAESFSLNSGREVATGRDNRAGAGAPDQPSETESEKVAHLERKDANSGAVGKGDGIEKGLSVSPSLQIRMVTGSSSDDAASSGASAQPSQTRVKSAYDYFDFSEDHPGNKQASEDYECPHCHESFDYNEQPEKCMGTVACPHCKKFVPQDGKPHRLVVRFTRFEIHKLAKMVAPLLDKSAAIQPAPANWNFDEGIFTDPDASRVKGFADSIHHSPQPWQQDFKTEDFINTYANKGHEAMNVKPYGADLLPWIAQARRAYGVLEPNSQFAWKGQVIRPPASVTQGIDFNDPAAKSFTEFNPDGSLKGIQDSALHYLAFKSSPHAAYRQMWNEFDAPTNDHMNGLLQKYQEANPQFEAHKFDKFVSDLDPEFYKHKQMVDANIGRSMRPTAQVYADFADKALVWDKATEKPREVVQNSHLPAIAAGVAGLGAVGLAYYLWQRHRKRQQEEDQDKSASAKQLSHVEDTQRQILAELKKAKEHSDKKEYGQKSVIMTKLFRDHPNDFIMDDDWDFAGVTHVNSGFRIHVPRNTVPAEIATSPLTKVWQKNKSEDFKRMGLDERVLEDMAKPASKSEYWIGVDLDSTLAWRPQMKHGIPFIGKPVAAMKKRVMAWINGGQKVKIFTARAASPGAIPPVKAWLKEHGFPALEVTNEKDQFMVALYDDRAIGVEPNTGKLLSPAHDK